VLCVLAEFCFLFPDLLVTKDALPFYKANLGLFRGGEDHQLAERVDSSDMSRQYQAGGIE